MDGSAVLFAPSSMAVLGRYQLGVTSVAHPIGFSTDGRLLALAGTDGVVHIVDAIGGRELRKLRMPGKRPISVAFSPTGRMALGVEQGGLITLDSWTGEPKFVPSDAVCMRLCFSPDGKTCAIGARSGEVALIDAPSMANQRVLESCRQQVTHVEFSPDGRWLAASSHNGNAYLFEANGRRRFVLEGHWARLWNAAFSPDGRRLLTNGFDGTARVWDVQTGKPICILRHGSWVSSAAWSPDGMRIVTACADSFVRVFDPDDGFELLKLSGHTDSVLDAAFTPDGKTIVSGGDDCTLKFWRSESATTDTVRGKGDTQVRGTAVGRPPFEPASLQPLVSVRP